MKERECFFERKKRELGVSLNDIQRQAVLQTEGPLLLLASPGSGKTTTIIMRIGYLIEELEVEPSRIKAVTFSRASARDMKERFSRFFPELLTVDFSTIHSLAFEVVRDHFRKTRTDYQIIEGHLEPEEEEQGEAEGQSQSSGGFDTDNLPLHKKIILRKLYQTINGDNITDDQMEELTTYISYIKNKMIPPGEWSRVKCDVPQAERVLHEYESFKRNGHSKLLIDFDDMLTIGNEVLDGDRSILRRYQQRYDYVLTDESQDTSMVQHAIVEKLVEQHGNLCVVADDDQSIYSWRGAEPSYLLEFQEVYPDAVTLFMEQNYRSSKDVVDTANRFIKRNKNRYEKNMFTQNGAREPILLKQLSDYKLQAKYLVQEIQQVEKLSEVAILFRNNSSSISLMNEFDRAGIPFYMKDADNRFFSHWVVEDVLNFMRISFSDRKPELLEKIHMKVGGYITKQQMAAVKGITNNESVFDNLIRYAPLQDYQMKQLPEVKEGFRQMRSRPPLEAIRMIRGRLGYEKALERMCERLGFRKEYLIGILNTLEEIADTLETMEDFAARLKHLEGVMKTAKANKGQNAVTFSTLHSAKGLEFERVYMIDLIEGIIPSKEDMKPAAETEEGDSALMEEAVRLFYVGMTRAKAHLELLTYRERDGEKVKESPFVLDVRNILYPPPPKMELKRESVHSRSASKGGAAKGSAAKSAASNSGGTPRKPKLEVPYNPNAIRSKADLVTGQSVKHRVFGIGLIVQVQNERIYVRFSGGEKALAIDTCLELGLLEPA